MALKVAYLPEAQIEAAARELLTKFAKAEAIKLAPPIDVEAVIERYFKIDLGFDDLRKLLGTSDALGAGWFDHARIRIDTSLENEMGRATFTMAHEVGHWWLHRPQYEADKLNLSMVPLAAATNGRGSSGKGIVCRSGARKEPAEWQADFFASRFLMPTDLMRSAFKGAVGEPVVLEGLTKASNSKSSTQEWRAVADTMRNEGGFSNVSNEAMRYRLAGLKLVVDADEVASRLL